MERTAKDKAATLLYLKLGVHHQTRSLIAHMPDFDLEELPKIVTAVLEEGDQSKLKEFIDKVDLYLIVEESDRADSFPDSVFDFILKLMDSEMFLAMEGSSKLLLILETDWVRLSEAQRQKLLLSLGTAYENFKDRMSFFIASELLGQYYCNEDAFGLLRQLRQTTNITARSFLPHAFEHIAKGASEPGLRKRAAAELVSLTQDQSPEVETEAAEALRRLPPDL